MARHRVEDRSFGGAAVIAGAIAALHPTAPAFAQPAAVEEVVVTARKREERLLDTPVAVSAVTEKDIEALGLANLNDITKATPGFFISNYGTQRNDRASQVLTIRGMPPSINTIPSASVFINGAPVTGGFVPGVSDLERAEVIKGPQSAYFGRSSFAGAVNLVTKTPGDEFAGSVSALAGSDAWTDFSLSVEGPLVADRLRARLSARSYSMDGQYTNNADQSRLGDRATRSLYGVVDFTPTENLRASAFITYWEDEDGAPATGKFTVANDFDCRAGGTATYLCGTLPRFPEGRLAVNLPLRVPFANGQTFTSLVTDNGAGLAGPLGAARHSGPGLYREAWHANLSVEYLLPNAITLSSVTGYNQQYLDNIVNSYAEDLQNVVNPTFGTIPNVYRFPALLLLTQSRVKDFSQELRVTSDGTKALRWMLGVNYYETFPGFGRVYGTRENTGVTNFSGPTASTLTVTEGVFGSLAYDLTENLTATVEARYQRDEVTSFNWATQATVNTATGTPLETSFDNFIPRVNLQYTFSPDLMVYATYAEGVNPGTFNTILATETQARNFALYAANGIGLVVEPETLTNYEIGAKGRFWEGRGTFAAAAYMARWRDQIIQVPIQVYLNAASTVLDFTQRPSQNSGNTDLMGIELDATLAATDQLSFRLSAAWNDSEIKTYSCPVFCQAIIGAANQVAPRGNALPVTPRYNGLAAAQYTDALSADWRWYVSGEYVFAGPIFADITNVVETPAQDVANFRVGLEKDDLLLEAFVLNAFDDYYFTTAQRDTDQFRGTATQGAIYVGPPVKRQLGVRARYRF
jgi:iron complex outermembrane recepter protein